MSSPNPTVATTGVADLTYRGYDGPLQTRTARFWTVSLAVIRTNLKKPAFWVLCGFILLLFFFNGLIFFVTRNAQNLAPQAGNAIRASFAGTAFQSVNASYLFVFLLSLVVGAGSISADNQANALLVYLAKPLTKGDYLLGKWLGVFVLLAGAALVPALVLYLFFVTAYNSDGFLAQNPWLGPRLLGASLIAPLLNACLIVGFSAWCKSARMTGAIYAGFYFVLQFLTATAGNLLVRNAWLDEDLGARRTVVVRAATIANLSVSGVSYGVGMGLMHVTPQDLTMMGPRRFRERQRAPWPLPLALLGLGLVIVPLAAARARVKAVEVIAG
jgi:ABC-type transport system involved in multi-copper enzyme maturation permease subunit